MRSRHFLVSYLTVSIAAISFLSGTATAEKRVVQSTVCSSATTTCYTNLQSAIDAATAGDTIEIRPGTYTGKFLINKNISIYGTETMSTFISGGGNGTALTVSSVTSGMTIRKLTFMNAATGIQIQNSSSVAISNNVFLRATTAGVDSAGSTGTQIINNVFYRNGTGIASNTVDVSITNNIFSNNTTAISQAVNITGIKNNLFFGNSAIGPTNIIFDDSAAGYLDNIQNLDPLFVNPDNTATPLDFHLKSGTPAQNKGHADGGADAIDSTTADIGAYGGSNSDSIPAPVIISQPTGSGSSISVTWSPNLAYQVGGYKFYTGSSPRSYGTPTDVGLVTSHTFTASSMVSAPTGTPLLTNGVASETLPLFWETKAVVGATGYEIHYTLQSSGTTTVIDVGNRTDFPLTGLVDATSGAPIPYYDVFVIPYAQDALYMAVTAYYSSNKNFESNFSNEVDRNFGGKLYGIQSNTITDYPEVIQSPLNLPDSGCFIATAAYGSYSSSQVQALRDFRDYYLMNNRLGKAFVNWYYRVGPSGAAFINDHPWMKPIVRAALYPAVGVSLFLLHTTLTVKAATALLLLLLLVVAASFMMRKRVKMPFGGSR